MLLQWRVISREGLSRCTVGWCEFKLSLQITGVSVGLLVEESARVIIVGVVAVVVVKKRKNSFC